MHRPLDHLVPILSFSLAVLAPGLSAQGTGPYLNFEAPSHHAITVLTVGDRDYLAVCNAPDNSVEIWTAADLPTFVLRVPVGQEPVTVVVKPTPFADNQVRLYTANWLGDSITAFDLEPSGNSIACTFIRSMPVGDEPVGIAFMPETTNEPWTQPGQPFHEALVVTFSAQAGWGLFDPASLFHMGWLPDGTHLGHRELFDPDRNFAVKDPCALAFDPTATAASRLVIANRRGGNSAAYDFDLWISNNLSTSSATQQSSEPVFGGLGSTNFDAVFRQDGVLYVCGHLARNNDLPAGVDPISGLGEAAFLNMVVNETGFTRSFLARVSGFGAGPATDEVLDLNLDPATGNQHATAVTQPTAIAVYDTGAEATRRIFVTGFSSDTLGVVQENSAATPVMSVVDRLDLATANPFSDTNLTGTMRGPRALVVRDAPGTSNDRVFVYNRVEHSITVVNAAYTNPASAVIRTVPLKFDPTPAYIHDGRKIMYSSALSGGDNASCSSCHVDSNTDFLAWNLSDGVPVPAENQGLPGALGPNQAIKGPMVTQPLRGIVNFEVEDQFSQQIYYSNRPYHWRGDRGVFQHFNGAFVGLLGINNPAGGGNGISDAAMDEFTRFTNSVHYPPNPEQPWTRRYSGTPYSDPLNPNPADLDLVAPGNGAARGLKLFHIQNQDGLSCVGCHTLPEASNNRLTEALGVPGLPGSFAQSLETAQMKALFLKDKRLIRYDGNGTFATLGNPALAFGAVTGEFGTTHTGFADSSVLEVDDITLSANNFITVIFGLSAQDTNDLQAYTRELDSGVSPLIGFTYTVDYASYNLDPTGYQTYLVDLEAQALEANCGLVFHGHMAGARHGFFFDVRDLATPYHEMRVTGVAPIGNLSQLGLFDYLDSGSGLSDPANWLTLHCVPLGSERRVAYLGGGLPGAPTASAPSNVSLLPCVPMSANENGPAFTTLFFTNFLAAFLLGPPTNGIDVNPLFSQGLFETSLLTHAAAASPPSFGLTGFKHEVPRRFCVSGTGIELGAILRIYAPTQTDVNSSPAATMPTTTPIPGTNSIVFEGPIYPARDDQQNLVWESAIEIDNVLLAALMNGGPHNLPVATTAVNPWNVAAIPLMPDPNLFDPSVDPFQPLDWNWYWVEVENIPGNPATVAAAGWQQLTIF